MERYEKEHLQKLHKYLAECTVFLKRDEQFPLEAPCEIALYGNGARHTVKGGTGSGEVNSRFFHTVEKGLTRAGFTITTSQWLDAYDAVYQEARKKFKQNMRKAARKAGINVISYAMGVVMLEPEYRIRLTGKGDAAIYVLSRICGEGADRKVQKGDFLLTDTEVRDIRALQKRYAKFMLVLNTGGPMDLTPVLGVKNILVLSQLGVETGDALADILLGKANPSGKLASTWCKYEDYPEFMEFGGYDDNGYKEGIYVGYRYFDTIGKAPVFPFGYGLSYTDFELTDTEVSMTAQKVHIAVKVKNTGKYAGKEVVQAYVSVPEGDLDQPYQSLAAFGKTKLLKPGEECEVKLSFSMKDLAGFDYRKEAYVLEKGDYILRIGTSSVNTNPKAVISLDETVTVRQVKRVLGLPNLTDFKPDDKEKKQREEIPASVVRLPLSAKDISCKIISYNREYEIEEEVKKLTDEELTLLSLGAFSPRGGIASMVGNSGSKVAGAAGETAAVRDIPTLVMADGPAGLRICKKFFKDSEGAHGLTDSLPESMMEFMPGIARALIKKMGKKPGKDTPVEYQYATAIPIGTAIAQSFNTHFAEECGDIVGAEMERFGVHLWLAPALNIHRNMLCGRNFEYFSEDPYISGKMAAAITKGVQKHENCGVTIKHYAANNQELNRTFHNSQVSERAMREIYLKGFEICVKEANPIALMTSYNLLNGVHTSEHKGLIADILRNEWHYEGIVMTDWVMDGGMVPKNAKYKSPRTYRVAKTGGDLFMPGSLRDYEELLQGLKEGKVKRTQLEINVTRIYRLAKKFANDAK